ncbi:LysR family transcriptional regulator [Endozoicomonas sp. 2B-B]
MAKVTLEQWRMLHAVVEHGGFAQAAEALHKSQSTVSYAVNKLQQQLDVEVLVIKGRKAELTEAGKVLIRRSQSLLKESDAIEKVADSLSQGWEGRIILGVDVIFPPQLLSTCLKRLASECQQTHIELVETVLSGTTDMMATGQGDLVISGLVPQGFMGEPLMKVTFKAVAHKDHPLHQLDSPLSLNDLKQHRQIVIRDSGVKRVDAGWLEATERWTVSHISTSVRMISEGLGFAWLPIAHIEQELASGMLKPLNLQPHGSRRHQIYLIYTDQDYAGPAVKSLANILKEVCADTDKPAH